MTSTPTATKGWLLGRIFGARIVVQRSTVAMVVVLALVFATGAGASLSSRTFGIGLMFAALLCVSVFLHELAHAAAARAFQRQVNEIVLTLWGGHTSYDARKLTPGVMGLTSLAGPLANLLIAGLAWIPIATGILQPPFALAVRGGVSLYAVVSWLVWANLILAIFNALPGIPMDGGRVLEAVVWARTGDRTRGTTAAAWCGRVIAVLVIVVALAGPVLRGQGLDFFAVAWAFLVFVVVWPAASAALSAVQTRRRRLAVRARDLAVGAVALAFDTSVAVARTLASDVDAVEVVVLSGDGVAFGHFPISLTDAVTESARATTEIQAVTMALPHGAAVAADADGEALIEALQRWWGHTEVWVVLDEGSIVGVVRLADAMKALQ